MGRGTKGLSLIEHGPHVDKTKFPDAAFVELKVFISALGKSATITRKVSAPRKPKIVPADSDVKAALDEIADHPELTLSRREILRFILVEPAKRSEEIQTILKLEEIGQIRAGLNTCQNKLQTAEKAAAGQVNASRDTLQRHLQIATFQATELLVAVNVRREVLGLPKIDKLTADTKLDAGLSEAAKAPEFNKQSVLRDLKALSDATVGMATLGKDDASAILTAIAKLESDPALLEALNRRSLIEKGLDLVDGPDCPLCDQPWDNEEHLREHLKAKLAKSAEAGKLHDALLKSGTDLAKRASPLIGLLGQSGKIAKSEADSDCASLLGSWAADLESFKTRLASLDGVMGLKDRLVAGWPQMPGSLVARLRALVANVEAKPDQTATIDAQTFLSTAQLRLTDYRDAMRRSKAAVVAAKCGKVAYDVYCRAMEDELNALYDEVQGDFSTYYRAINEGDEVSLPRNSPRAKVGWNLM
jgi:hypothetical protein